MSKIEAFWRDATADDVARVMAGETVEARFRNSNTFALSDTPTSTAPIVLASRLDPVGSHNPWLARLG